MSSPGWRTFGADACSLRCDEIDTLPYDFLSLAPVVDNTRNKWADASKNEGRNAKRIYADINGLFHHKMLLNFGSTDPRNLLNQTIELWPLNYDHWTLDLLIREAFLTRPLNFDHWTLTYELWPLNFGSIDLRSLLNKTTSLIILLHYRTEYAVFCISYHMYFWMGLHLGWNPGCAPIP